MSGSAIYPGSFDPVTNGHLDIIARASAIFDRLVIVVGVHHGKAPLFTVEERVRMLEEATADLAAKSGTEITVGTFESLTVDAARAADAPVIIRGLRDSGDFDYEMQMAGMNGEMAPDVETIFLAASPHVRHIAGTLVRQISAMGGNVAPFVPEAVAAALAKKV